MVRKKWLLATRLCLLSCSQKWLTSFSREVKQKPAWRKSHSRILIALNKAGMGLLQSPSLGYDIHLNLSFTFFCWLFFLFCSSHQFNECWPCQYQFPLLRPPPSEFGGHSIEIYCWLGNLSSCVWWKISEENYPEKWVPWQCMSPWCDQLCWHRFQKLSLCENGACLQIN